jgi:glycosyltransferase involved in cell wall biosynthesis
MDLLPFIVNQELKRQKFRKNYGVSENENVVVQIGRLVPVKNHQLLIKVIALLQHTTKNNFRFFIVGDGEEKKSLQQLASSHDIDWTEWNAEPKSATLTFTGWQHEVDEIYAGADLVTLTSLNEGTPVTLIEAMAANKKIVATDVGGVSDVLVGGKFGALVPSNHAEAFSRTLQQKILCNENPDGEKRTFAISHFGYKRLVSDTEKLYDRLLFKN